MSVTVVLEFKVQPDKADTVVEFLRKALPATRAYAGFESLTLHRDQDDPSAFLIWEQWATRGQYDAYLAWRTESGTLNEFVELLAGPPSFRFFDHVGA